jgi:hypothetical protein
MQHAHGLNVYACTRHSYSFAEDVNRVRSGTLIDVDTKNAHWRDTNFACSSHPSIRALLSNWLQAVLPSDHIMPLQ